jgi:hypothetical protein
MQYFTLRILLISAIFLYGCNADLGEKGDGNIVTEQREISPYSRISLGGAYEVRLQKSTRPGLSITTDANLMELIEVSVSGKTLEVTSKRRLRPTESVILTIDYQTLEEIEVSGAAKVRSDEVLRGEYLTIDMAGAGDIELELEQQNLGISVSGAGSVNLKGKVIEQTIKMSGAGSYEARDLISQNCSVNISGVGSATIYVQRQLNAQVSGVGGITYYGSPTDVKTEISGLGSIEAAKE